MISNQIKVRNNTCKIRVLNSLWTLRWPTSRWLPIVYEILSFDSQEYTTEDCKENLLVYPKSLVVLSLQLSNEKLTDRCNQLPLHPLASLLLPRGFFRGGWWGGGMLYKDTPGNFRTGSEAHTLPAKCILCVMCSKMFIQYSTYRTCM